MLNAASAEWQEMRARVEITDNIAQAGSIQINNVTLTAPSLADIDRLCLRALRCPDSMAVKNRLKANKDKLLPKSIEWILKHPRYKTWQDGDDVCLLWIKGGAGKGKTMMSIGIIEDLSRLQHESTIVTYFFCQNADCELNTLEAIIKGLMFQLVYQQPVLNQALRRRWDTINNRFDDSEDFSSWRVLWNVFLEMLEYCKCQRVYIIMDALDECESDSMADFLKLLVRNGLDRPAKIKWLLTSRPLDTAERELLAGYEQVQVSLELNLSSVSEAVKIYISSKMTELDRRYLYGEQLKREIQTELIKKAEGTFLWVSLVCKELESVCRNKALTTIRNLPSGLHAFYSQIINQLSRGERADVQKYIRLFTVMMLVYRPLKLEEIRSVTGLTDNEDAIKLLVDQCASFIKLQENKIEFVHKSARDYLAGENAQYVFFSGEHFGPDEIAFGCLSYLSERLTANLVKLTRSDSTRQFLKGLKDEKKNVLLARVDYAATFWVQHLEDTKKPLVPQTNLALVDTVIIFLQTKFLEWLECVSLLGKLPQAMEALKTLANLAKDHHYLSSLVQDATRFLSRHYHTIANWPLQIYSSAIIFSPESSILKRKSMNKIPIWLRKLPTMEENWSSLVQTLENDFASVNTVAFSPNGKYIASGSDDDTVKLWDSTTGDIYKSLESHSSRVSAVTFSPDGKQIVSGSWDCTLKLWDSTTGVLQKTLIGHISPVTAVAFSADGQQIASGSDDNTIKLWNSMTGDPEKCLSGHSSQITAISFSLDGKQIVSGAYDNSVKLWDTTTGEIQKSLLGHSGPVMTVVFSLDNKQIISGAHDNTIKLWDTATANLQKTLVGHSGPVTALAVSLDGKQLASGSFDKTIKLWDTTTTNLQKTLEGHSDWVNSVAFTPDSKQIISGSSDNTIKLWNTTMIDLQKSLAHHSGAVTAIAFSLDGKNIISGGGDNDCTIKLWDTITGDLQKTLIGHSESVTDVAFSPDGKQVISSAFENDIKLWDTRTGSHQALVGHSDWVNTVTFSPDGEQIASGAHDNTIKLWNSTTGTLQITLRGHSSPVTAIAFSSDGDKLASSSFGAIKLWDVTKSLKASKYLGRTFSSRFLTFRSGQEVKTSEYIFTIKFSSDDRYLATNIGRIKLENLPKGGRSTTTDPTTDPTTEPLKDIYVRNQWICHGEIAFFRLPSDFVSRCYIVQGDQVAIGFENGRVLLFEIDRSRLRSMLENNPD